MKALTVEQLSVSYPGGQQRLRVVDKVSFSIPAGKVLGLVGESGSGKSTVARAISGLVKPDSGTVRLAGVDIGSKSNRGRIGMIFQDPYASLNPRMTVHDAIREVVSVAGHVPRTQRTREVQRLLDMVQLSTVQAGRLPAQLSGGQRQRAAIARAMASRPTVLVADEITSALDVSVQAAVLNVMKDILRQTHISTLFISHNLAVVRYLSDEVAVMHAGQIVEQSSNSSLFASPQHPYTSVLIASVPALRRRLDPDVVLVEGDPPHPHDLPSGCRFHPRCPAGPAADSSRIDCLTLDPTSGAEGRRHLAACHYAEPIATSGPERPA